MTTKALRQVISQDPFRPIEVNMKAGVKFRVDRRRDRIPTATNRRSECPSPSSASCSLPSMTSRRCCSRTRRANDSAFRRESNFPSRVASHVDMISFLDYRHVVGCRGEATSTLARFDHARQTSGRQDANQQRPGGLRPDGGRGQGRGRCRESGVQLPGRTIAAHPARRRRGASKFGAGWALNGTRSGFFLFHPGPGPVASRARLPRSYFTGGMPWHPTTTDYPLLQHVQTTVTSAVDQNGNTFPQSRTVPGLTLPAPGVIPSLSDANAPICACTGR